MEDAEVALVLIGSSAGTAKVAVDQLRAQGMKAGLVKIRVFRPFPGEELAAGPEAREGPGRAWTRRRASPPTAAPSSPRSGAALYDLEPASPSTVGYVYGLGGRDIAPCDHFHTVFARLRGHRGRGRTGPGLHPSGTKGEGNMEVIDRTYQSERKRWSKKERFVGRPPSLRRLRRGHCRAGASCGP